MMDRPTIAGGYADDKVIRARQLLRDGKTLIEMMKPLGYRDPSSVRTYLKRMGLPMPTNRSTGNRRPRSDEEKQAHSQRMKSWHSSHNLHEERGNKEL